MDEIKLWQEVFNLSYGNEWVKIPDRLRKQLRIKPTGICGGILCNQHSAMGANEFISRLNSVQERIK